MKNNPFSIYDFMGYFIPGIFTVSLYLIITVCKTTDISSIEDIMKQIPKMTFESTIILVVISYIVGHFLSFVSSITVEKYSVWRFGYPSRFLLQIKIPRFRDHYKTFYGFVWGSSMFILLLPTLLLDLILVKWFGFWVFYVKPLDNLLKTIILSKLKLFLKMQGITETNGLPQEKILESDFFRTIFHYYIEKSTNHISRFTNYLAMYGFLRTITLIMNLFFWYLLVHFLYLNEWTFNKVLALVISALISYVFFMAFMKFFRKYTLQGLMLLATDKDL